MLKVGFAFNFNIQRCEIEVGDEEQIIRKGYEPLLKLFIKHGLKADCFVSGFSSERIQEMAPDVLDLMHQNAEKHFRFGTYTYTHPIPQLLTVEEFSMQMQRGIALDKKILRQEPHGFLPPEFAFTKEMGRVLYKNGIRWFIALASQIQLGLKEAGIEREPYAPCRVALGDGTSLVAIPAAYELPDNPPRYEKLMMKGQNPVSRVIGGIRKFAEQHPDGLLLIKRDAETVFIDAFNSGFGGTYEVMDEFLGQLSRLDVVTPVWIDDVVDAQKDMPEISLPDYLGNTRIETFTEGEAAAIWEKTLLVREKIFEAEREGKDSAKIAKAWNHLLLSHNSDGRIGYWHSTWNPGEHTVAPSRRKFVEDNLEFALKSLA
ncbi:polysaccharide deacetylase family protein [Parasphaerochaeta coccoides]|uniref:Glycoside hydrolase family 57 n=1 Tax=Parasphaerochaeta coccoides (strain ATCC BAA-1237 / DSM 17374 / SPN1) TaxID=760011 RepID=F4GIR8_PARC1|nr:polysaccharide deacetylase family protein [Parasphaerochaeta coccoides]AEC02686.1 glycoside hydrolase family 57 [Parasphaerochaeta coccoides DSM 17374]